MDTFAGGDMAAVDAYPADSVGGLAGIGTAVGRLEAERSGGISSCGQAREALWLTGDRAKVCKFRKIGNPKAGPLAAVRQFNLSRKSLGGIETDLGGQILRPDGAVIDGLCAVGEAAGFGGGGARGEPRSKACSWPAACPRGVVPARR